MKQHLNWHDRRSLLRGIGVTLLGVGLSGCAGPDDEENGEEDENDGEVDDEADGENEGEGDEDRESGDDGEEEDGRVNPLPESRIRAPAVRSN
ncbi:hypothetical protein C499_14425 [Halogeometricum borinquense DSM 11551]|uniref:Uncharacterized protein n=1 Tax=Halogeometricum borinquense (strain ATCC 700274 / DSM 11551 / JCM 10706 / KCTC 4070 / PR3) TaxID=469382 RepID=E4NUN3_HALBP|nr:hypothetical protein [Halogeometricum borinquense]ADQ68753.1 hypothetical protein Hbor_32210 [Halogeometricum borinquense DSM 11551]ELY25686.1 hypothetical protein C499_14425 [Halogeometricum borinquense DSM 11551]